MSVINRLELPFIWKRWMISNNSDFSIDNSNSLPTFCATGIWFAEQGSAKGQSQSCIVPFMSESHPLLKNN